MSKTRRKFFYLSIFILSLLIFAFFNLIYYSNLTSLSLVARLVLWYILAIILGTVITYGYTITSSAISDAMATMRRLLRAENLSNPLILRLSAEAPGTYHHSLNVSNMAQRAAKTIGADSLMVRVAAYYHDLGKLKQPELYIENQSENEIPREENSTWIRNNAKRIISHVETGIRMAKDAGLPTEIIDIIAEHHGTTKALYFFEKAKEKGLKIRKTDFSYHGPVPQTPESAIIMLSDCVEAAARTCKDLNRETIKNLSNSIIEEKIKEGQLEQANLNESDLLKIRDSFVETLSTIYHQRISYNK